MKNFLGIVGGVGPLASNYLYEMITKQTKALKDQDHLDIVLFSHASIPDRTAYILDNTKNNPYPLLLNDCLTLEKMGAEMIVIPCNTSCYFHSQLQKELSIPLNNMIKDTTDYINQMGYKKVAIMATTGTINSNLYQNELEENNIEYVLPNQDVVMDFIYNYVKAGKNVPENLWTNFINNIPDVDAYILGCTELSVIKKDLKLDSIFIDPLEVQTNKILNFFNKEKN